MKQYLDLLNDILENGVEKESGRANMPNTIGLSYGHIRMDLQKGFPLLTTKKMFWKGIIHELLWFLRGDTNIKYLVDNNVNIWNDDAYKWYLKKYHKRAGWSGDFPAGEELSMEGFIDLIKNPHCNDKPVLPYWTENDGQRYTLGDLGKVYGYQWRNQNGVDQVRDVIEGLRNNPYSRYHIIDGWNKSDFKDMALPPCHLLYQFTVKPFSIKDKVNWLNHNCLMYDEKPWTEEMVKESGEDCEVCEKYGIPKFFLDLNMYQRSCDVFLGVPFNLASMSLLLILISKISGMEPGVANWIGGNVHIYKPHIDSVKEQINRTPFDLPKLSVLKHIKTLDDILSLTIDDFDIINYKSHPKITAELFTGLDNGNKK